MKLHRYAIGSPCASRSRSTLCTSLSSATLSAAAISAVAGTTALTSTLVAGRWPAASRSS